MAETVDAFSSFDVQRGELEEILFVADRLLNDPHDLIHKAVGWMLREVGHRDRRALNCFLKHRYRRMPRTMLVTRLKGFQRRSVSPT
jgi:3-methyladenine DNA glycosylase AlkD